MMKLRFCALLISLLILLSGCAGGIGSINTTNTTQAHASSSAVSTSGGVVTTTGAVTTTANVVTDNTPQGGKDPVKDPSGDSTQGGPDLGDDNKTFGDSLDSLGAY